MSPVSGPFPRPNIRRHTSPVSAVFETKNRLFNVSFFWAPFQTYRQVLSWRLLMALFENVQVQVNVFAVLRCSSNDFV
jgi:hypothetical protein